MTKIASRPIYGKNLLKSCSLEPRGWWPWNMVYSIGYSSTTKYVQMMTLGWPWPFLGRGQICFVMLLHGWKLIQHIVMYFQGCSNSTYPLQSSERYRTIWSSGLLNVFNLLFKMILLILYRVSCIKSYSIVHKTFDYTSLYSVADLELWLVQSMSHAGQHSAMLPYNVTLAGKVTHWWGHLSSCCP